MKAISQGKKYLLSDTGFGIIFGKGVIEHAFRLGFHQFFGRKAGVAKAQVDVGHLFHFLELVVLAHIYRSQNSKTGHPLLNYCR